MHLYYNLALNFEAICAGYVGDFEAAALAVAESTLKYHPDHLGVLT